MKHKLAIIAIFSLTVTAACGPAKSLVRPYHLVFEGNGDGAVDINADGAGVGADFEGSVAVYRLQHDSDGRVVRTSNGGMEALEMARLVHERGNAGGYAVRRVSGKWRLEWLPCDLAREFWPMAIESCPANLTEVPADIRVLKRLQ